MRRYLAICTISLIAVSLLPAPVDAARRNYKASISVKKIVRQKPPAPKQSVADPLVTSALTQEVAGDSVLRDTYLREAIAKDPDCESAHWQLGEVSVDKRWLPIDDAIAHYAQDERYHDYRARRLSVDSGIEAQSALAKWCREAGLTEQARAHYLKALRQDAMTRWRDLNPRKGTLTSYSGVVLESPVYDAVVIMSRRKLDIGAWRSKISPLRSRLADPDQHDAAAQELMEITDPQAIPAMEYFLSSSGEPAALVVVTALRQMPHQAATVSLVSHALRCKFECAREAAVDGLRARSTHNWVPLLLAQLKWPERRFIDVYNVAQGIRTQTITMSEEALSTDTFVGRLPRSNPSTIGSTAPIMLDKVAEAASIVQAQIAKAELRNIAQRQAVAAANTRIGEVFVKAAGAPVEDERGSMSDAGRWWHWWADQIDAYYPADKIDYHTITLPIRTTSCFIAGTPVWTSTGPVPIELLEAGDMVLSQHIDTGELTFKPVLAGTVRPATNLLTVHTGEHAITVTRGHPFWVTGKGWRMTKELNVGDRLRTPTGSVAISSIEEAKIEKTYNLIVADFNTYFVGDSRLLVHDNTLRQPTQAVLPGLVSAGASPR